MTHSAEISYEKAIELTESALSEVNQLAMEQIRRGAEISSNIEAAERDLRGALRQLVLAERRPTHRATREEPQGARDART
jgi:hypothetical protein